MKLAISFFLFDKDKNISQSLYVENKKCLNSTLSPRVLKNIKTLYFYF
jgi:hypothetical protein